MNKTKLNPLELIILIGIALLLFWPVPVDSANGPLHDLANWLFQQIKLHPSLSFASYWIVEKASNVLLFVPLGYIIKKHTPRKLTALFFAAGISIVAELAQKYIITNRVFAIDDIVANIIGATLGIALAALFNRAKTA